MLVAYGLPSVTMALLQSVWLALDNTSGVPMRDNLWWATYSIGPVIQLIGGLYLIFGGRGLINYCCRGALGMCPACNYDVRRLRGQRVRSAARVCLGGARNCSGVQENLKPRL